MEKSARPPMHPVIPERPRPQELIRPSAGRQREFGRREAQRRLREKESQWAPIAYSVFAVAVLLIFSVAYSTYVFSRYRDQILPGVRVDHVDLGGLTEKQAALLITNQLIAIHRVPFVLTFHGEQWEPTADEIGLWYSPEETSKAALGVGREGPFLLQLLDRLPLHPAHDIPLLYHINESRLTAYLRTLGSQHLFSPTHNATLLIRNGHVVLVPATDGAALDLPAAEDDVHAALGSLSKQTKVLRINRTHPAVTDAAALAVRDRVERFLARPPVLAIGKRVLVTSRLTFAPMLSFSDRMKKGHPSIVMTVDPNKVHAYVHDLAAEIDRPAATARIEFSGGIVRVISPQQLGRQLDEVSAYSALLHVVSTLTPNARLRFHVAITQPPVDASNPASLGISTLLATGKTTFGGAAPGRLDAVTKIAATLDNVLIQPNQDVSFNTLVGSDWADRDYVDRETEVNGELAPSASGGIQQVATTFLRAMYRAGLKILERHSHVYRLPWYEPPVGLDAVVAPGRNWDLRFANTTGKYLLIETRVEPIRQELYVYVYGPKLGWKVTVDSNGRVTHVVPHGAQIVREDTSLAAGDVRQIAWPHDGADTVVQRTITYRNGNAHVDELDTHYQPSQAILLVGKRLATPTAGRSTKKGSQLTPTPVTSPAAPTPTPTFSH